MLGNPAAGGELLEQRLVEPARRAVVDVLDRRLAVAQLRAAQPALERAWCRDCAASRSSSSASHSAWREIPGSVLRLQLDEGVGHAVELQRSQLVDGGMGQHCVFSPQWK